MKAAAHRLIPAAAMLLCILCLVFSASRARAQMPPQEQVTILQLPPVSPHWIAASSFGGSIMTTPIVFVDGDSLKMIGTITGGLTAMFAPAPDHQHFYTADTYYSR